MLHVGGDAGSTVEETVQSTTLDHLWDPGSVCVSFSDLSCLCTSCYIVHLYLYVSCSGLCPLSVLSHFAGPLFYQAICSFDNKGRTTIRSAL